MKLVERLQSLGLDISALQSTDFSLWSDRRLVLNFFLRKICGGDEELVREGIQVGLAKHTNDDANIAMAKSFCDLFAFLNLDHITLEAILGTGPESQNFLEKTTDLIEVMEPNETSGYQGVSSATGLEGFMSTIALLDTACTKLKDLTKIEMDLFSNDLKQEAASFRDNCSEHLQCGFAEVLSLKDRLTKQFEELKIPVSDAEHVLNAIHPTYEEDSNYREALVSFKTAAMELNTSIKEFLTNFPTPIEKESVQLQGIGSVASEMMNNYKNLINLMELLTSIHSTQDVISEQIKGESVAGVKQMVHRIESQMSLVVKSFGDRNR